MLWLTLRLWEVLPLEEFFNLNICRDKPKVFSVQNFRIATVTGDGTRNHWQTHVTCFADCRECSQSERNWTDSGGRYKGKRDIC